MTPKPGDVAIFLREKIAKTAQEVAARESMVRTHEHKVTRAEWRAAMALHPSTRGTPMPTDEQRAKDAAIQRRIADKLRQEVRLYEAALAIVEAADA